MSISPLPNDSNPHRYKRRYIRKNFAPGRKFINPTSKVKEYRLLDMTGVREDYMYKYGKKAGFFTKYNIKYPEHRKRV